MQIAGDLIVKAMDWPGSEEIAERLAKALPPELRPKDEEAEDGEAPELPPEVQQKLQEAEQMGQQLQAADQAIQKMQQELDSKQAKDQTEAQKATNDAKQKEIDGFKAQTERLKVMADIDRNDLKESEKVQFDADFKKLMEDMRQDFAIELEWLKSRLASGQGVTPLEAQTATDSLTD